MKTQRILFIHQHFKTPEEGGSIRSFVVAKKLVEAGHKVTLISGHNSISGTVKKDGITVEYFRIPYDNSYGFYRRIYSFLRFVRLTKRWINKNATRFDLAYVMTTPLTTGFIAVHGKQRGIPYVFEVGDLWPDVPVEMGILRFRPLINWLYVMERKFYDQARLIIAMSPDIAENIRRKSSRPVEVIPNFSQNNFFQPKLRSKPVTAENPFEILYCGAFGKANELQNLLEIARSCDTQRLPVSFTLMGDGAERDKLIRHANGLKNIRIIPHGSKLAVKDQLDQSDAVIVSFAPFPTLATGSPNKFFDALAAGKLVIVNFDGWIAPLIQKKHCGFNYGAKDADGFINQIQRYFDLNELSQVQQNARKLAMDAFDSENLSSQIVKLISKYF